MSDVTTFIQDLITEQYNLGEVQKVESIKAGDTNNSFLATCKKNGEEKTWYVRQYNLAEEEQDIIYEHAFEQYLNERIAYNMQTLLPIENSAGKTWVVAEHNGQSNFYALFNTISGREPYSWEFNDMSKAAMASCAKAVAQFHAWAYGFEGPEGSGRREPPLEEQFRIWKEDLPKYLALKCENKEVFRRFTDYFENEVPFLIDTIQFCECELDKCRHGLKKCINHKDLNPGNLMFDEKDEVIAVFDLDWVNTDYRLYDIGWMGYQAIASWDTASWGAVPIEEIDIFLDIYNKTIVEMNCPLGILTAEERQFVPTMMIIGAIKVIMDFSCYEDHTEDMYRMFVNTWRFVESVRIMRKMVEKGK